MKNLGFYTDFTEEQKATVDSCNHRLGLYRGDGVDMLECEPCGFFYRRKNDLAPKLKNLGWVNGWESTPEIVLECRELDHKNDFSYPMGKYKGVELTTCRECGYYFQTDST